jgi:hypothetical protein
MVILGLFLMGLILTSAVTIYLAKLYQGKTSGQENQPAAAKEKTWPASLFDVTETEKAKVRGKTDEEIKNEFNKEKQDCLDRFKTTQPENILAADVNQAISLITCQAIKNNNLSQCDLLKTNQSAFQQCQEMAAWHLKVIFPALRSRDCSAEIIKECEALKLENCQAICQGFILGNTESCNQIKTLSLQGAMCLAITQKNISLCQSLQNQGDITDCQDIYYFIRAVKENQPPLLDNIKNGINFAIGKLFFNQTLLCEDLLTAFNEPYCSQTYSPEALNRRLDIAKQLKLMKN